MTLYRNNLKESIILLLIGLLSPIIALPFIFLSIYKKNLYSVYVLGFILALLIGFMPPYADNYHYYLVYKDTYSFNLSDWFVSSTDFLFYFLCYIFNSLHISYVLFRLCITIFEMLVFSWIFVDFIKTRDVKLNSNQIFLIVLIMWLAIDIMFICFMIRFALMATLLIWGIYLLNKNKFIIGLTIIFLAFATHFGGFLLLPGIILAFLSHTKITNIKKILFALICIVFGLSVFSFLYKFLPDILKSETYITGSWSGFDAKSFNGMMYYILQYYFIAGIIILYFILCKTSNNLISRVAFWGTLIFLSICSFSELSQRVWWMIKFFILFSIIDSIINTSSKKTMKLYGLVFLLFFAQMLCLYGFREAIFDRTNLKHLVNLSSVIWEEKYDDAYFFRRSFK